jgi:glycyl-tRNA synthetase
MSEEKGPDLDTIMALAKRRGFFWPAFEIYGGTSGFFDYGPLGSLLKENMLTVWKDYYVVREGCLLIDTPDITPEDVFIASGHVEKFEDVLTRCEKCGAPFRADHLLEEFVQNAETLSLEEMDAAIKENNVECSKCKGTLTYPEHINLMFESGIGPGGDKKGYLRPETAQGMFINFHLLYRLAREKLPFGVVQIGRGYRNEISPRQGLIRVRELNLAECEYFINPSESEFEKIDCMEDMPLTLVPNTDQQTLESTVGESLKEGMIKNQTLAYFLGLTRQYLLDVGIDQTRLRFRQHLQNEMAHYARDCWDAEVLTSLGWIEVVGIADRSAYDISRHQQHSGQDMRAFVAYDEPRTQTVRKVIADRKVMGPLFKGDVPKVVEALESAEIPEGGGDVEVELNGEKVVVPGDAYTVEEVTETVSGERFVPDVIEPSYGMDRILYCILEHCYESGEKEGEPYVRLRLPAQVAPVKVGVFPLMAKDQLDEIASHIDEQLRMKGLVTYYDGSGSIGKRYARVDEVGTPFSITVDYESKDDGKATIRERDTTDQVRVTIQEIPDVILDLVKGVTTFSDLK